MKNKYFNTFIRKITDKETKESKICISNFPQDIIFELINYIRNYWNGGYSGYVYIREKIKFVEKNIDKEIDFSNCIFKKDVDFSGCTFNKKSSFSYIKNNQGEIIANASIFEKGVNFSKAIFKEAVNFSGAKFGVKQKDNSNENNSEVKFLFENAKFQKEIDFSQAIFYDTIYFSGTEFCTDIKEYKEESINFENAQFRKKVRFHHCKFHNTVRFENTLFNKLVDFYSAHFHKAQQFHFTDFLDRAIFSNTEFDEEVQFLHCKVTKDSYVRFESAIFNKGLDISRSNFNDKVNFWNIEIKEGDIFTSSKYADDFEVHKNEINPEKNIPSVYKQLRETYRIIKDNLYKQNNKIEGLHFSEKEMSVYLEEKRAEDKKSKQSKDKEELMTLNSNLTTTTSNKKGLNNIRKEYVNTYNFLSLIELFFLMICIIPLFLIVNSFLFILPIFYIPIVICTKKCRNMNLKRYMLDKTSVLIKKVSLYIEIVVRICFYRLQSLKNKSDFLFMLVFLLVTLASGIIYIIEHKYIWYWLTLFLFALWVYLEFYQNRRNIKYTIRSNNYISLVLLCIPMMLIFIMLYGVNDYENDLIYKILSFIFSQFSMMFKGDEIFKFFLITILIFIAIIFSIISKKQDKLLLWFNKNSNIFDTDWVVGINFTILVTLIAYIVILSLNPNLFFLPNSEGVGNFLRGLVDVLNITDWRYIKILGKTPSNWQYVFLFIGRIFVAYGIYQTVQAFRKFGKS